MTEWHVLISQREKARVHRTAGSEEATLSVGMSITMERRWRVKPPSD